MKLKQVLLASAIALSPFAASAECTIEGTGEVNVLSNFFEALEVLAAEMETCERDGLVVETKLTTDHKEETNKAFESSTSPWDAAAVANSSITLLQAKGQLRPLNDLVEKYRDKYDIEDGMLIRFGDDIMAIAFMVNAQHLFYRKDIFEENNITVPTTWDEVLEASEKLKQAGIEHPYGAAFGNSWELANEYVNLLLANGGTLFDPETSDSTFETPEAIAALERMGALYKYMSPNSMSMDFGDVKRQLQQGDVAMAVLWGNEASGMDNPDESTVVDKIGFAPSPTMIDGGVPASTFWWDGYVMPKNLDGDPDLTFQVLMHAMSAKTVKANNDITLWIRSAYEPGRYTAAITETVLAGAPPYPMNPQASLAHSALGENIADFIVGKESAQESLADATKAYRAAAREQGLLK
ncbi:extracellular solute-binding protein [uncultured Ruegeria sp.]|uniref:extracellular solute-binding protein n=1 Tax=uncultured Ruegeria sp. TaxID=259304 RepID=UPI0026128524|nr:extracellular solute-binding protein [uncultured Ruegeria sp.]